MKKVEILNKKNETLTGYLHEANDKKNIVIFCEGFRGNMEKPIIKNTAVQLESKGINCFRFDFAGYGASDGSFAETTYTKRLSDLDCILDHFKEYKIGLIGHSQGGAIAVLEASKRKLEFLISIASSNYPKMFMENAFPEQKKMMEEKGVIYWWEADFGKQYPVTRELVEDIESYEPIKAYKDLLCPVLFIHGKLDTSVQVGESKDAFALTRSEKELRIFENSDHYFTNMSEYDEMVQYCADWIKKIVF